MLLERDFIMRSIHNMIRAILKFIFHIDSADGQPISLDDGELEDKMVRLMELVQKGRAPDAEALLYAQLDSSRREQLRLALAFYDALNEMDDPALEQCGFNREQIRLGIAHAAQLFGVSGVMALFDNE